METILDADDCWDIVIGTEIEPNELGWVAESKFGVNIHKIATMEDATPGGQTNVLMKRVCSRGPQCLVVGEISPTKDMIVVINKIVRGSEGVYGR